METSAKQRRRGGRGRRDDSGHRKTRGRGVLATSASRPENRTISPFAGEAAVYSESRREAAATGDPDSTGPSGANGGEVGDRTDLRGGLSELQLLVPAGARSDAGTRGHPQGRQRGLQFRRRRRHSRLLRQHRSAVVDEAGGRTHLGPAGGGADPAMVASRSDGGRNGAHDAGGNAAGRSDLTAAGQYLPESTGPDLGHALQRTRTTGAVCRRLRGAMSPRIAGQGSASTDRSGDEADGSDAASRQDADGGLEPR